MRKFIVLLCICSVSLSEVAPRPEKRGYFWPAFGSFFLPGFDQWRKAQYDAAVTYSGMAAVGIGTALAAVPRNVNSVNPEFDSKDDRLRLTQWGLQVYQAAGSLSAYQSFRYAVTTRPEEFGFLNNDEKIDDVVLAPFRFDFLARPTTFVPLLGAGFLIGLWAADDSVQPQTLTGTDLFFAGTYSYGAGVGEEALFRGWLLPVSMRLIKSEFWSNMAVAALFAAAHISPRNRVPWPQFIMGWYLGFLSQQRNWTIAESIFVHTWWDVAIFVAGYALENKPGAARISFVVPL